MSGPPNVVARVVQAAAHEAKSKENGETMSRGTKGAIWRKEIAQNGKSN